MKGRGDIIVVIVSAFPGQFGYKELINLDIRDTMFWYKEAQKKLVQDQIKRISACRMAMVKDNDYQNIISELERQLRELEMGKNKLIKSNWDSLKLIGRKR